MKKKITITLMAILALICITTGRVFAAPQSSPNVSHKSEYLKEWVYSGTKYIPNMIGASGTMGNTIGLNVHLQRNTEYGAMLILGISDYGKQASGVNYNSLFTETSNGLATTTGNVSGVYQVGQKEFVAAGQPTTTQSYYLNSIPKYNRDEYSKTSSTVKRGDAMGLFGGTIGPSNSSWLRETTRSSYTAYYYVFARSGFGFDAILSYDESENSISTYDNGRRCGPNFARAVVTQYN